MPSSEGFFLFPGRWNKDNLREIPDKDYLTLLYFLTGREHVKETKKGGVKVAGLKLKDEGDFIEEHLKITKRVIELNNLN